MIDKFEGEYFFLSNFYEDEIIIDGLPYKTVEHYYQARKAYFSYEADEIREAATPNLAKKIGRQCRLHNDWEARKFYVMRRGLAAKFFPGKKLAGQLLETGDEMLMEGNWWGDKIWGTCKGKGNNWLGWLLMAQRAYLRSLAFEVDKQ